MDFGFLFGTNLLLDPEKFARPEGIVRLSPSVVADLFIYRFAKAGAGGQPADVQMQNQRLAVMSVRRDLMMHAEVNKVMFPQNLISGT